MASNSNLDNMVVISFASGYLFFLSNLMLEKVMDLTRLSECIQMIREKFKDRS